jgi:hypothetical protein
LVGEAIAVEDDGIAVVKIKAGRAAKDRRTEKNAQKERTRNTRHYSRLFTTVEAC